jgi:hypothetical protein
MAKGEPAPKIKVSKTAKSKRKPLSKGQATHVRRVKQESRKSSPDIRK